jgi:hypothetical protein
MFVIFICITETRLGWAGLNLIYDGVETLQIASIYDGFCKKRYRVNLWHVMPRGRGKLGAEQRDLAGSSWLTDERLRSGTSTTQAQNKMEMRPTNKNQKFAPQKLNTIHIQPRRSPPSLSHLIGNKKISLWLTLSNLENANENRRSGKELQPHMVLFVGPTKRLKCP